MTFQSALAIARLTARTFALRVAWLSCDCTGIITCTCQTTK